MKKKFATGILVLLVAVMGTPSLWAQQQGNVVEKSLEDAFLGANPEKANAPALSTADGGRTPVPGPAPAKQALSDGQRLEKLMGVTASKGMKGLEALRGPARAFVIAVYDTGTPVVSKASRIAWDKISGVVTSNGNQPEIIATSPGNIFEVNGSSYVLSEGENGIALTFVTNARKNTILIGTVEGAFITADGYVCRVKRYEEG